MNRFGQRAEMANLLESLAMKPDGERYTEMRWRYCTVCTRWRRALRSGKPAV